jgi:hypothetical protein
VAHAESARLLAASGRIPLPLVDSPKCPRCSLVSICLPDETAAAMGMTETEEDQERQLALFSDETECERRPLSNRADEPVRRLVPARDDLRPLYVTGYGLSIGKKDEVLQVRDRDGVVQEARLHDISQVNVFGGVAVTSAAVQALCGSEKPIAYFSAGHWFFGFDPFLGFYHQPRFGRPALALDLMEGFRPLVVDSAVVTAVNTQMVGPGRLRARGRIGRAVRARAQRIHSRLRAADGHPGDASGLRLSCRVPPRAGDSDAAPGARRQRRAIAISGIRDSMTRCQGRERRDGEVEGAAARKRLST